MMASWLWPTGMAVGLRLVAQLVLGCTGWWFGAVALGLSGAVGSCPSQPQGSSRSPLLAGSAWRLGWALRGGKQQGRLLRLLPHRALFWSSFFPLFWHFSHWELLPCRAIWVSPGSLLKKCFVVKLLPLFLPPCLLFDSSFHCPFFPPEINNSSRSCLSAQQALGRWLTISK